LGPVFSPGFVEPTAKPMSFPQVAVELMSVLFGVHGVEEADRSSVRIFWELHSGYSMKILAMIVAGVAAVLFVGYLWRRELSAGKSERLLSKSWEGPNSDWRNSSENQ
jgi:hypothetical protein